MPILFDMHTQPHINDIYPHIDSSIPHNNDKGPMLYGKGYINKGNRYDIQKTKVIIIYIY